MKTTIKFLSLIILLSVLVACSKEGEIGSNPNTNVFINYSIAGNSKNGTFNITGDDNNSNLNVYGVVAPNKDGDGAVIDFLDGDQLMSVSLTITAAVGSTEITDTNPYGYDIGFGFEDISLQAKAISITISEINFNGFLLNHIKGSFTGTAVYTYSENGEEIEEPHLVDGNFEYNNLNF